jgi:transposase
MHKTGYCDQATHLYFGAKGMICGVDVSSKTLDVRVGRQGPSASFANDEEGIVELAQFCRLQKVDLVVMEATGGYERQAFAQLWACGLV